MSEAQPEQVELRPYQRRVIERLREAFTRHRAVMLQAATGSGKTEIALWNMRSRDRAVFVTPRRALIADVLERCERYGIPAINATRWKRSADGQYHWPDGIRVVVGSPPPIEERVLALGRKERPTFCVIDEAHHAAGPDNRRKRMNIALRIARRLSDLGCSVMGMTATPMRLESDWGYTAGFEVLVPSASYEELRAGGWLVPVRVEDVDEAERVLADESMLTESGEFDERGIMAASSDLALYDAPTRVLLRLAAAGRKCLVYCVGQPHALELARRLQASTELRIGFTVSGDEFLKQAPADVPVAEDAIAQFRAGELDVLINVGQLTVGYDDPECDAILMLRPTNSELLWRQVGGRLTRPAEGKDHGLLIDAAGNFERHGQPDADREWPLESIDAQEVAAAEAAKREKIAAQAALARQWRDRAKALERESADAQKRIENAEQQVEDLQAMASARSESSRKNWEAHRAAQREADALRGQLAAAEAELRGYREAAERKRESADARVTAAATPKPKQREREADIPPPVFKHSRPIQPRKAQLLDEPITCECGEAIHVKGWKQCIRCYRESRGLDPDACLDCGASSPKYPRCWACQKERRAQAR